MKRRRLFSLLCALPLILFSTCALTGNVPLPKPPHIEAPSSLTLLFAGDIMAHTPNFSMADYGKIWEAVTPLVSSCDLSFANIESPVMTSRAFSTYPDFNMQPTYPEAAIKAGFNVFSTANNHSNDQGLEGIQETRVWADVMEEQYKNTPRPLYFSGIRTQKDGDFSYRIIQVKDWTVLFCAVTELLNRNTFTAYLNYVPSREETRAQFKAFLHNLRAQNPCDLFVLSIHSDEPEYVADVSEGRQKYYRALLDCGVDVVWANHPHVVRGWQSVGQSETEMTHKLSCTATATPSVRSAQNRSLQNRKRRAMTRETAYCLKRALKNAPHPLPSLPKRARTLLRPILQKNVNSSLNISTTISFPNSTRTKIRSGLPI